MLGNCWTKRIFYYQIFSFLEYINIVFIFILLLFFYFYDAAIHISTAKERNSFWRWDPKDLLKSGKSARDQRATSLWFAKMGSRRKQRFDIGDFFEDGKFKFVFSNQNLIFDSYFWFLFLILVFDSYFWFLFLILGNLDFFVKNVFNLL